MWHPPRQELYLYAKEERQAFLQKLREKCHEQLRIFRENGRDRDLVFEENKKRKAANRKLGFQELKTRYLQANSAEEAQKVRAEYLRRMRLRQPLLKNPERPLGRLVHVAATSTFNIREVQNCLLPT